MNVKGVVLDFDGVILDSFRTGVYRIQVIATMEQIQVNRGMRKHLAEIWGKPGIELMQEGLGINRTLAERLYGKWECWDQQDPPELIPGVRQVLHWLRRNDFRSCLLTSRFRPNVELVLERHDLMHDFACITTREDLTHPKPDPRSLRPALEALQDEFGIAPTECIFVGDTPSDIAAGHNAGIETLVVQTGPYLLKHANKKLGGKKVALQNVLQSLDDLPLWIEEFHEGSIQYLYD